jgi:hypothetical protein
VEVLTCDCWMSGDPLGVAAPAERRTLGAEDYEVESFGDWSGASTVLDLAPQAGQASLELSIGKQCQPGVSTLGRPFIEGVGIPGNNLFDVFVSDFCEPSDAEGRSHLVERGEAVRDREHPGEVANQRPLRIEVVVDASDQDATSWLEDASQFECAGFEVRDVM